MVYLHYAEMDTWLIQITDDHPIFSVDHQYDDVHALLRDLVNDHPSSIAFLVSPRCSDQLSTLKKRLNEPWTHSRLQNAVMTFTVGERFV